MTPTNRRHMNVFYTMTLNRRIRSWSNTAHKGIELWAEALARLQRQVQSRKVSEERRREVLREINQARSIPLGLRQFLIYSPENSSLRTFETEGQIQPLGMKGEGLFKLLTVLSNASNLERLTEIKKHLALLDWFDDFEVVSNSPLGQKNINIRDKFLDETLAYFTQKSANEGFLFLLFYFTLFISQETPSFFAIDNIDASLNPKLCSRLVKDLVALSKEHGKQAILTTHNPAILDGLDLSDDEQRLYVVYRNKLGQTKVTRIHKSEPVEGQPPVRLSEAFLRGYLGRIAEKLLMPTFALVTEGLTDQIILEEILFGFFDDPDLVINSLQPLRDATDANRTVDTRQLASSSGILCERRIPRRISIQQLRHYTD